MAYQCKVCKQQFMCTAAIELMEQHVENKHKGKTYEDCFDWIYVAAPNMATVYKGSRAAHAAFGVCGRVYVYMCVYVCLCVCVCARTRARLCVYVLVCVSLSMRATESVYHFLGVSMCHANYFSGACTDTHHHKHVRMHARVRAHIHEHSHTARTRTQCTHERMHWYAYSCACPLVLAVTGIF